MTTKSIQSGSLPNLNGTTKDLINSGTWVLYEIDYPDVPDARYCLAADKLYFLSKDGSVISQSLLTPVSLKMDTPVKFADLPHPEANLNFIVV